MMKSEINQYNYYLTKIPNKQYLKQFYTQKNIPTLFPKNKKNNFCHICNENFDDYKAHIMEDKHFQRKDIYKNIYHDIGSVFKECYKNEIKSKNFSLEENFIKLKKYLECNIINSNFNDNEIVTNKLMNKFFEF